MKVTPKKLNTHNDGYVKVRVRALSSSNYNISTCVFIVATERMGQI